METKLIIDNFFGHIVEKSVIVQKSIEILQQRYQMLVGKSLIMKKVINGKISNNWKRKAHKRNGSKVDIEFVGILNKKKKKVLIFFSR